MTDLIVRRAIADDLLPMGRIAQAAYHGVDLQHRPMGWPAPAPRGPERVAAWAGRTELALLHDPEGVWVAQRGTELVGLVVSRVREGTWILSSLAVAPHAQGQGVGAALLERALHYGRGCLRGLFCSSNAPAAVSRYVKAGFDLHPQFSFRGEVDRALLPTPTAMRDGSAADIALLDEVDRSTRAAGHGPDHTTLQAQYALRIRETPQGTGYVYIGPSGGPELLAATTDAVAVDLLWEALAWTPPGEVTTVDHVNGANQWAVRVAVHARLATATNGYLAVRGMVPPRRYVPHGSLL